MRQIKFRAWDKQRHHMLDVEELAYNLRGELVSIYCFGRDFSNDPDALMGEDPDLDRAVLMQYTGLRDKNGREVYEGDIVKNEYGDVVVVQYGTQDHEEDYGDRFVYQGWNIQIGSGYPDAVMIEYTVIGNIYENPELMEVAEHDDD